MVVACEGGDKGKRDQLLLTMFIYVLHEYAYTVQMGRETLTQLKGFRATMSDV